MSASGETPRAAGPARFFSADRITALLFVGFVAVYGWDGARLTASLQVDVIGPAFFPKILAALGLVLGILLFVRAAPRPAAPPDGAQTGSDRAALIPAALMLGYVLAFEPLGFPLATVVFLAAALRYLKHPGWPSAVGISIVITTALWGLFSTALGLKLPLGVLAGLA